MCVGHSGRGQGTPALRHGIQCISSDEQAEVSSASLEAAGDASGGASGGASA